MSLDPVEDFLTMQQAATALQDRLRVPLEDARLRADTADAAYYSERSGTPTISP